MSNTKEIRCELLKLESGYEIQDLKIQYTTYGTRSEDDSNVVWIVHAYTANCHPSDWWSGLVGEGKLYDPAKYFIICANNLGSCYGTTGATSINPNTGKEYGFDFPLVTIRDSVEALDKLRCCLGIKNIHILIGGSIGGQIAIEWAIKAPELIENLIPIATNAKQSPWAIAFNEAQRMALKAGEEGLKAARAIALLSYRGYEAYNKTQADDEEKIDGFNASTYQQYQGEKLAKRFDAATYYCLSKTMDTHDVGRNRGSVVKALAQIKANTLVIGIDSDILFPLTEQMFLTDNIPSVQLAVIKSIYAHDGFLIENEQIGATIESFLTQKEGSSRTYTDNSKYERAA
jgi:homoserine O-acetyltransferase